MLAHIGARGVRRLACDAKIIPLVYNAESMPVDLGRTTRTISPAQRIALNYRDQGCKAPGCDRPPAFCDAHHVLHWIEDGETELDNLALTCGAHHDAIHHGGWDIELGPDRKPQLRPPPWIDPQRRPVTNSYWHTHERFTSDLERRF